MTKEEMAAHIEDLTSAHEIEVASHSSGGRASRKSHRIAIRPVKSGVTYAIALHEIGHLLGPHQKGARLEKEGGAWQWAVDNAEEWTDLMQKTLVRCLKSYADHARRKHRRGVRNAPKWPCKGHCFWELSDLSFTEYTSNKGPRS